MRSGVFDKLPILVCETAAVRNESGEIIDLEWIDANDLMNASILPEGGSVVGMRIFEFDPAYRESEMVKAVLECLKTGKPGSLVTTQGRAAKMLNKVLKTSLIPTERGVLCCSHEITDIAQQRDEAKEQAELLRLACDRALHGIAIAAHDGAILYMNPVLEELSEQRFEDVAGQHVDNLMGTDQAHRSKELQDKIASGGVMQHISDGEMLTPSGKVRSTSGRWQASSGAREDTSM